MRKKSAIIAGALITTSCMFYTKAQESFNLNDCPTVLEIKSIEEASDGGFNYKTFEIEAEQSGHYYAEFWVRPAQLADDSYTTFYVYVNNNYVGEITPSSGNWQSIRINNNETLDLNDGVNLITILTKSPETPDVETIRVAKTDSDATISSEYYDTYLEEATLGTAFYIPTEATPINTSPLSNGEPKLNTFPNLPLNYTFYKTFNFTKGQDIFITSASDTQHNLDIVFYGTPYSINLNQDDLSSESIPTLKSASTFTGSSPTTTLKRQIPLTPATSEEMQGLNWMTPSQQANNSQIYVATHRLTIPKSGYYLVRLRTTGNGATAVADININGNYYYENVPMSLSMIEYSMPADGNRHTIIARCNNPGVDDSFLFIHGAHGDRIVGFNDDVPVFVSKKYDLSALDSYISQKYFIKTSAVSVSNYSSLNPNSTCDIISIISEKSADEVQSLMRKITPELSGVTPNQFSFGNIVNIPSAVSLGSEVTISSTEQIKQVSIYAISGTLLTIVSTNDNTISTSTTSLGMSKPGLYIACIETVNGTVSKKIIVR